MNKIGLFEHKKYNKKKKRKYNIGMHLLLETSEISTHYNNNFNKKNKTGCMKF